MSDGAKGESQHVGAVAKPSFGSRVKAHFKRFWWLHIIIFIIVFLVILLPVIYVGYPNIAQSDVDDSTVEITQMAITNPSPDSLDVNITQQLGTDSAFHPQFDEWDAVVYIGGTDTAFLNLHVPAFKAEDGTEIQVEQSVSLENADAFGEYATAVMLNETVTLDIRGNPQLQEGKLPKIGVDFNKAVTMKGLNSLKGFDVTDFKILSMNKPDGSNMEGTVFIPNPSVMTLEMGNLTLNLAVAGENIGTSSLKDLTLHPGDNTVPMTSIVDQAKVIKMVTGDYKDGMLPIDITGNSTTYNGEELPYYTAALSANKVSVTLDVGSALDSLFGGGM
ncbi:hypothetical protein FQN54_008286 [Arachnomyces sp. PD_36]|nr:hypothetical protein FQN54_008286 [Arachnomyces sp. PD_36]